MASSRATTRAPGDILIAGRKTINDWHAFRTTLVPGGDAATWQEAFDEYFHARLSSRYLKPITTLQKSGLQQGEGFSIVAIQCSLIEFLESTLQGKSYRYRRKGDPALGQYEYSDSGNTFESFLVNRRPFNAEFTAPLAHDFYVSVRCGVLHEARTKNGWTVLAKNGGRQTIDANKRIIYRDNFQAALISFVNWYKRELPSNAGLQEALIRKFDSLCVG
jgi:hypothetical protein